MAMFVERIVPFGVVTGSPHAGHVMVEVGMGSDVSGTMIFLPPTFDPLQVIPRKQAIEFGEVGLEGLFQGIQVALQFGG